MMGEDEEDSPDAPSPKKIVVEGPAAGKPSPLKKTAPTMVELDLDPPPRRENIAAKALKKFGSKCSLLRSVSLFFVVVFVTC